MHEGDVGQALHNAVVGDCGSGFYNLAGDGIVDGADVPRLLGFHTLPLPRQLSGAVIRLAAVLPNTRPALGWFEMLTRPLILDTTRARRELGWRPRFSSRDALAATGAALGH